MRALQYAPDRGTDLVDLPVPEAAANEVLLQVDACGVCGSDRQIVRGETPPFGTQFPLVLGHEIAGTIVAVGDAVDGWDVGDEVLVHPFCPCGTCAVCRRGESHLCSQQGCIGFTRQGGFAEYVAVPADQLVRRPAHLDPAAAAILVDAYATPQRALVAAHADKAATALVIGTGGLGLAAIQLLKADAVARVASASRRAAGLDVAQSAGAEVAVALTDARGAARAIRRFAGAGGVDLVLDTVGDGQSLGFALDALRPGGTVVIVGMPAGDVAVPMARLVRRGVRCIGSYGSQRSDVVEVVKLAADGRIDPPALLGRRLALEDGPLALATQSGGRDVILPQ
ncbi:alcohol dehydrogenase GroES domain-containing protein [Alicyclobacillus hesperidum URH17-3-68]|uniref:Iditol 2-dehydrogenase n=1 Tax=Alicyclobacillus hesperidum TaxID=89784 RepID=A0AA37U9D7_9BACL|nr:alcohol dehydrogenase catalytic domain-containing protein [Alicyclobacillus hesperidum]EJY55470.1 alcohol dehydrogenase GroES domain-containing protein [Alicyclobacillus hesperidum URH17-3-68]GLV13258.1 iditol 2-dehydrogenase [Alicyclobacillus hesperidum]